ncbi:3'-5' exonuclease [Cupriavidus campinensis]|uniref:3'-5' exonuclease n=1 Tax=Cupriavidus campinensis TaxID=151783 RepID=A0ABY3EST6_9BURK|nr:3'-5' exonuclease [Cupriavidus campinensis]TSP14026.1 3'-5' exonuclease [Cupriavidus campinensis]
MKIGVLDTETTGLDPFDGHKIIELALFSYELSTRTMFDRYVQRIDPERSIAADAQRVHGISYEELFGMPKFRDIAPTVHAKLSELDLLICHNAGFDVPFVGVELVAAGLVLPPGLQAFCTMEQGRFACFDGKLPKLQELCFAFGIDYDPAAAHAADYDVIKTADCFFRGVERGFYQLPVKEAA